MLQQTHANLHMHTNMHQQPFQSLQPIWHHEYDSKADAILRGLAATNIHLPVFLRRTVIASGVCQRFTFVATHSNTLEYQKRSDYLFDSTVDLLSSTALASDIRASNQHGFFLHPAVYTSAAASAADEVQQTKHKRSACQSFMHVMKPVRYSSR